MKTQWTMIYWQSDTCWLGKLLEHPEIMTHGRTLEELEENLKEAYLLRILADVPDGYQTKTIRCEIPTRRTLPIPGVGDQVRSGEMTLNKAERASQEGLTIQNSGADAVYTALRKLDGVDDQLLDRPEIAHLASILEGDETPECVATNGQCSSRWPPIGGLSTLSKRFGATRSRRSNRIYMPTFGGSKRAGGGVHPPWR